MIFKGAGKFKKEAQEQYRILAIRAKKLQGTIEYIEFADQYAKLREKLIAEMLNCDESDPLRYAFQMNSYVERIKALGILVSEVNEDIRRKENEESEDKA